MRAMLMRERCAFAHPAGSYVAGLAGPIKASLIAATKS